MKTCLIFESENALLEAIGVAVGPGAEEAGAVGPDFGAGLGVVVGAAPGGTVVLAAGAVGAPATGAGPPIDVPPPHPARAAANRTAAHEMETRRNDMESSAKRRPKYGKAASLAGTCGDARAHILSRGQFGCRLRSLKVSATLGPQQSDSGRGSGGRFG